MKTHVDTLVAWVRVITGFCNLKMRQKKDREGSIIAYTHVIVVIELHNRFSRSSGYRVEQFVCNQSHSTAAFEYDNN